MDTHCKQTCNHTSEKTKTIHLLIAGIAWPPETFLARLIKGLIGAGAHVTIAGDRRPDQEWLSYPNVNWLFAPGWRGSVAGRLVRLGGMMIKALAKASADVRLFATYVQGNNLRARLRHWYRLLPFAGHRWDLIYIPWNGNAITYMALFDLGCPVVISCRGSQVNIAPHNPFRHAFRDGLRLTFQKAAAVHCVSDAIQKEAMRYGLISQKAWIIRPAVDPNFFLPEDRLPTNSEPLRVITVGSLNWCKGYEYALLAIRRLVDQNISVRFEIIGDGPEYQRILYTICDLGLIDYVHLYGRLPPIQVRNRLQQADIFLLSSLSEGISNAALEAMSCGLPVVTSDCGGMREAINDGVEGFIVPLRTPEAMANALIRLANAPDLRRRMGQAGRRRVLAQFTLADQVTQFLQLCTTVVDKL